MIANRSVLTTIALAVAVPSDGYACSRGGFPAMRTAKTAHFIALPTADTLLAGPGTVSYVVAPGHSGPGAERAVYGQVVSIERIGGLAAQTLRRPVQRVVLVPWDYGADCTPTPWTRSAAWAEPAARGLFTAVLRDSAHWAGGHPTFDVFAPELQPYPQQLRRQMRGRSISPDSIVPMDELFDLIELLPDQRLLPDSADAATQPLFAWARANPTRAHRYPISQALSSARFAVATQRLRAIESPVIGTYRFIVTLTGSAPRTFFVRTRGFPISQWNADGALLRTADDPTLMPRPDGYHLLAAVAESLSALPASCMERPDDRREAYIVVVDPPGDSVREARDWTGSLEVNLAGRALDDAALHAFERDHFQKYSRRSRAGLLTETPARFTQSPDGTMRVEQTLTLPDGRALTMTGERISRDIVACRW